MNTASPTGKATTSDWLNASQGMTITAYDPAALSTGRSSTESSVFTKPGPESVTSRAAQKGDSKASR